MFEHTFEEAYQIVENIRREVENDLSGEIANRFCNRKHWTEKLYRGNEQR